MEYFTAYGPLTSTPKVRRNKSRRDQFIERKMTFLDHCEISDIKCISSQSRSSHYKEASSRLSSLFHQVETRISLSYKQRHNVLKEFSEEVWSPVTVVKNGVKHTTV